MTNHSSQLRSLAAGVTLFRSIDAQMPAQAIHVLLLVAERPGISFAELENVSGLSRPSVSRNIMALGHEHRNGKLGYGLVEAAVSDEDGKSKVAFLTTDGKALVTRLLTIMSGKAVEDFTAPTLREAKAQGMRF